MGPAGRNSSDWKGRFLFVGNQLALDFLNTRPVQNGEPVELLPDFDALLRWFQAAELLGSRQVRRLQHQWEGSARAQRIVVSLRKLREGLRKDVLAWERGGELRQGTVEELNRLMADHPLGARLMASGRSFSLEPRFEAHQLEDLFAPLAYSAAALFAKVNHQRVRKCDQCVLHFHDISKRGTRRWCSMQLCGNRRKVAAYLARQRVHTEASTR